MTCTDYLKAYAGDLKYNLSNGLDYINSTTESTQYFYAESDAENYIKGVTDAVTSYQELLEALVAAIAQCEEYSDNEWVMPRGYEGFHIETMKQRILKERTNG